MGKGRWIYTPRPVGQICVICKTPFRGPGDRCPQHRQQLAIRRKRKPR